MQKGEGQRAAPRDAEVLDRGDEKDRDEVKKDKDQDATRDAEVLERGDKKDKDKDKKDGAKKRGQNRESRTEKNAFEFRRV